MCFVAIRFWSSFCLLFLLRLTVACMLVGIPIPMLLLLLLVRVWMLINRLNLRVVILKVGKVLYTLCYVIVTIRVSIPPELLIRLPGLAVCPSINPSELGLRSFVFFSIVGTYSLELPEHPGSS
jgi:hypothetical protein